MEMKDQCHAAKFSVDVRVQAAVVQSNIADWALYKAELYMGCVLFILEQNGFCTPSLAPAHKRSLIWITHGIVVPFLEVYHIHIAKIQIPT